MILIILIVVILLLGTAPYYPYSRQWGYGPSGILGLLLIILLLFLLFGNRGGITIR